MADDYQRGSDIEWLKHSHDEFERLAAKNARQAGRWRLVSVLLILVLGWVVYRYSLKAPVQDLWQLPPELKKKIDQRAERSPQNP